MAVNFRYWLYRHQILKTQWPGVPTIVVGNVIVGGAGKTPLVIFLVKHLQSQGLHVGIISRGYGRSDPQCNEVLTSTPIGESGDEPMLIKRLIGAPVFVGKCRFDAATALLRAYPKTELLICDDGLQHYGLMRDIEIAVFDDRGVGNGWLIPAGPLREHWPARIDFGLDLILHTGEKPVFQGFTSVRKLSNYALAQDGSRVALTSLTGKKITAIAAIANPEAFFKMLRATGLIIEQAIGLPDHFDFVGYVPPCDPSDIVLCTEKDAVKLFGQSTVASLKLLAVPLQFSPEPAFLVDFDALIASLISKLPSKHEHQNAGTSRMPRHKRLPRL